MFIREDKIYVIASRYLPISLEELRFHVEATGEELRVSKVTCADYTNFVKVNSNEILIGEVSSPLLTTYLSASSSLKSSAKSLTGRRRRLRSRHYYTSNQHKHNPPLRHLLATNTSQQEEQSTNQTVDGSAIGNLSIPSDHRSFDDQSYHSNYSQPNASSHSLSFFRLNITLELYDIKIRYQLEESLVINYPDSFVVAVMVGHDNLVEEIITFMEYYLAIGTDHFLFYFLMPIESLPDAFIDRINGFRNRTVITIIQWFPFYVDGPYPILGGKGSSELALIQDGLYRVKSDKHTPEHKAWFAHVDLDDFLVVHPQFADMKQMLRAYPLDAAGVVFHNSYFYLMREGENWRVSNKTLPLGFTWEKFNNSVLVHETDLKHHNYRPKVIANAYHVLSIGGHRIDLVGSRSYEAASCTFYLHFIKPSRGRGKRMVISARESRLAEFLTLPRDVDLSSGIEAWTTEHKKSFFRQQSGQPVSSHANVHNHNNHHPIVQTDRSRSNYRQVNVDDWIRTNLDKNKLTPSTSIRGTEDRSKFAIADRLQQQFKSTEEKGEDSMGQSTQQEIVSGPGIYETRSHRLHSPQAARSANPNRNQPARDSEQSAQRGYDGPLRIQHTRVIPEPGSLNYNKPSYAATDLQSGQTFNLPAEAQKRAYFDRMNHFQELLAHSRQRGTQQHSVYRSETGSSVSSSTSSGQCQRQHG